MRTPGITMREGIKARAYRRGYARAVAHTLGNLMAAGAVRYRDLRRFQAWQKAVDEWARSTNLANAYEPPPRPNLSR